MKPVEAYLRDYRDSVGASPVEAPNDAAPTTGTSVEDLVSLENGADEALARSGLMVEEALSFAAEQINKAKADWTVECQERLCREAAVGRAAFENAMSKSLVSVLAPFLAGRQRDRIRDAFVEHIRNFTEECPDTIISVAGPMEDITIVAGCLGKVGVKTISRATAGDILEAEIGRTAVRADLSSWAQLFSSMLGAEVDDAVSSRA